jgi:hypothetical protein
VKSDCTPLDPSKAKYFVCTPRHQCVKICFQRSDCAAEELCEDAQCRKPACANDLECGNSDLQCLSGACVPKVRASEVASCEVVPSKALLHVNATKSFRIVARNGAGGPIHLVSVGRETTWRGGPHDVSLDPENHLNVAVTGGPASGATPLEASINNVACAPASVTSFEGVPEGKRRVVVASSRDAALLNDAHVQVADAVQTSGPYLFDATEVPVSISVTKEGYFSVRLVDVTTNDVIVYLKPKSARVKLSGYMGPRDFDQLQDVKGTVHAALFGPSIEGDLGNVDPATHFGELISTKVDLGSSANTTPDLPEGVVVGLAENMFKGAFAVNVEPGLRSIWSLGGNVVLSDVLGVVSQVTGGGDIDVGAILSALLPVFGRLQASTFPFRLVTSSSALQTVQPKTLLRLQSKVRVPALVPNQLHGETMRPNGVVVLAGYREATQGFVPQGLTAGIDKDGNGKTDAVTGTAASDEGYLNLRFAPASNGLEGAHVQAVALVTNVARLFSSDESVPRVISGVVANPQSILFKTNSANEIGMPGTLSVPAEVQLTGDGFTHSGVEGAAFHRLDVGEWSVYFPASTTSVDLTGIPPSADVALRSYRAGLKSGVDYQSIVRFDGDDLDDLSTVTDAFSVRSLTSQDIAQ